MKLYENGMKNCIKNNEKTMELYENSIKMI